MTTKSLTLTASIIALSAISGMAHAKTAIHARDARIERMTAPSQMRDGSSDSFAAMSLDTLETNPHAYHGGPKSDD
jgi:hypothetical protein